MLWRRADNSARDRNSGVSSLRVSPCRVRGEAEHSSFIAQLIDGCLLSLLFVAPLLMGGRHPVGQFAWMLIASVLGVATVLQHRPQKPSAGDYLWLAATAMVMLQLVPLPSNLLVSLNPGLGELLPGLTDPAAMPFGELLYSERPISINPYQTRLALGMLLAYGVIFHAVARRVQSTADVRRILTWIAVATVAIGCLGLAQRFAGNGKFLWVYHHISRSASDAVKGPFQNQNHLAQLMALGVGPLLYLAFSRSPPWRTALATSGTTLCLLAGLLTFSRGGAIAVVTAGLVAIAGLAYIGQINRQRWLRIILPTLITMVLLGVWGGGNLLRRVESLTGGADLASVSPARLELWQSHLRAIAASPWVGYGAASHEDIYPAFIEKDFGVKFTHGESGYLPIQLENGLPGTILLVWALLLASCWAWQSVRISPLVVSRDDSADNQNRELRSLAVACVAGLAASAVQSLGDFVWYIPACLTPTLMLLACLHRLAAENKNRELPADPDRTTSPYFPWLVAPVAMLLAAVTWSIGPARASQPWTKYRILMRHEVIAHSADSAPSRSVYAETIQLLLDVIRRDPADPVPRLRLATLLLNAGDGKEPQLGRPDQELLRTVICETIASLRLSPLRGEGYVRLAHACHRAGVEPDACLALLEQALRVRASDVTVRYQAGLTAFRIGHPQWGLKTWKPVLESPTPERNELLRMLADLLPPDLLLGSFSLDHTAVDILYNRSKASTTTDPELTNRIGRRLVASLIEAAGSAKASTEAADYLHRASHVLDDIGGAPDRVIQLASKAVDASPSEYRYRIWLTNQLIRHEHWADATEQLQWCRARKPRDPHLARQEELILRHFQR